MIKFLTIIDKIMEVWNKPKIEWTVGDEAIMQLVDLGIFLVGLIIVVLVTFLWIYLKGRKKQRRK